MAAVGYEFLRETLGSDPRHRILWGELWRESSRRFRQQEGERHIGPSRV